jgi:hypothetical protein
VTPVAARRLRAELVGAAGRRLGAAVVALAALAVAAPARAQESWALEGYLGAAWNLPTPLSIHQTGQDDIKLTAHYETRPFEQPPYYAWRLGRWTKDRAWEFEFIHHKLFLDNPPDEVQHFEVTHGFNLLMVNRAWVRKKTIWRWGGGVVLAHPESRVRGAEPPEGGGIRGRGYHLTGPVVQGSIGRRFALTDNLFFAIEAKLTAAYARLPVDDGHASAPNLALHGLFGLGYAF